MTDGYSGTPQATKLGLNPGVTFDLVNAPDSWRFEQEPDAKSRAALNGPATVILAFIRTEDDLRSVVESQADRIRPAGALWIAWPRKAAGHASEVSENLIREVVLPRGLVDVKVAAIDTDWSGLKLVWRVENR